MSTTKDSSSVKPYLLDFAQTTSMKGVSRAVRSGSLCLRAMWILAFMFGFGMAAYLLYEIFKIYTSNETVTNIAENSSRPTFPDITLCNLNPFVALHDETISVNDYFKYLSEYSDATKSDYEEVIGMSMTENEYEELRGKMESVAGFHQNSQPSATSERLESPSTTVPFIMSCKWYDWMWGEITHGDTTHNCSGSVRLFRSPDYVLCYTIKVPETVRDTDVRGLTLVLYLNENVDGHIPRFHPNLGFSIAAGARVSIQAPGTMPDNKKGISVSPGHETTIHLQTTEYERLGEPYGSCAEAPYTTNPSRQRLFQKLGYSQSACVELCFQEEIIENCSCIDASLQYTQEDLMNYTYCGTVPGLLQLIDDWTAVQTHAESLEFENNVGDSFRETGQNILCANRHQVNTSRCQAECLQPCQETSYSFGITQAPWPHSAYMLALFEKISKDNPSLHHQFPDLSDLVSEWQDHDDSVTGSDDKKRRKKRQAPGQEAPATGPPGDPQGPSSPHKKLREFTERLQDIKILENNFLQVKILFEEANKMQVKQAPKVELVSALGNVGGIMNLWIGITFMTLVELCELGFKILMSWKRPHAVQNEKTDDAVMTLPRVDN